MDSEQASNNTVSDGMNLIKAVKGPLGKDALVLVSVIKNEIDILPAFLNHYRVLGVARFFMVDNDSSDGSREFLEQQGDVSLYSTKASYRENFAGLGWLNEIGQTQCVGHWTLAVDADEFFLPPSGEVSDMKSFLAGIRRELSLGVLSPLVGFFAPDQEQASKPAFESLAHLMSTAPWVIPFDKCTIKPVGDFPFIDIRSSANRRITGAANYDPPLSKIPLVWWREGFQFLRSTHSGSMIPLSDQTGILCHFKFRSGFVARHRREQENPDRLNASAQSASRNFSRLVSNGSIAKHDLVPAHGSADLHAAGWLEGGPFARRWADQNKSRELWAHMSTGTGPVQAGSSEIMIAARNLVQRPEFRLTRRLRRWLQKKGVIGQSNIPEFRIEIGDPLGALNKGYRSPWWEIWALVRLTGQFFRYLRRLINVRK